MIDIFDFHNTHWSDPKKFMERDPQLSRLQNLKLIYLSPYLKKFPFRSPGLYVVTGNRQIGKTTFLKQWIHRLVSVKKVKPRDIFYMTGEMVDDHHSLVSIVQSYTKNNNGKHRYLVIDEVNYIKNWDKGIKFLADGGAFENTTVLLTGSDRIVIEDSIKRFPGRRGLGEHLNFHISPLNFTEVIQLKHPDIKEKQISVRFLLNELEDYLKHGGYLRAINDWVSTNKIEPSTLETYSNWIRGDLLKQGKNERYLKEILGSIINR
jgi:uncharacterized protein